MKGVAVLLGSELMGMPKTFLSLFFFLGFWGLVLGAFQSCKIWALFMRLLPFVFGTDRVSVFQCLLSNLFCNEGAT